MASRLILITETGKVCTKCNMDLPLDQYYRSPRGTLGLLSECKSCWNSYQRNRFASRPDIRRHRAETNKAWRTANPERQAAIWRRSRLRRKFGISVEDYDAMLLQQGGGCAACRSTDNGDRRFNTFVVDHDHGTGEIRGLLCSPCNLALGHVADDPHRLRALITYLLRTASASPAVAASA